MQKKRKDRIKKVAAVAGTAAVALTVATAAYLMDGDTARNSFVIGHNVSSVEESFPSGKLEPGKTYTKEVRVRNRNSVKCFVRVLAEPSDSDMGDHLDIDWNTTDWTEKQDDGYRYYRKALNPGETTSPLFTKVSIRNDFANPKMNAKDFEIGVYEETVQSHDASSDRDFAAPQKAFESISQKG
jgi:hypothetical protein